MVASEILKGLHLVGLSPAWMHKALGSLSITGGQSLYLNKNKTE